jgi:hypothetical protein
MFGWLTAKRKARNAAREQFENDLKRSESAPRLHGVNLLDWRYLGRTVISYVDGNTNEVTSNGSVFSFCGHEDTNKRHFVVIPHSKYSSFDTHTWVLEHAALWEIGERELWEIVGSEPSRWLSEYMLDNHNHLWSLEDRRWYPKGTPAPKKKPKLELVKDVAADNNVVTLDFKGKSKEPETT